MNKATHDHYVLFSGGLDSTVLISWLVNGGCRNIKTFFFDYGSKHNTREMDAAKRIAEYYKVFFKVISIKDIIYKEGSALTDSKKELPVGGIASVGVSTNVVPGRNFMFLSIMMNYCTANQTTLYIGCNATDREDFPDCRKETLKAFRDAIGLATGGSVFLEYPFVEYTKGEIIKNFGMGIECPYSTTYSCYQGRDKHCGVCGACFARKSAFKQSPILDPTEYEKP